MLVRAIIVNANVKTFLTSAHLQSTIEFLGDQDKMRGVGDAPLSPGEVLRDMLSQRGWTQDELALILGVSRVSVANIIAGRSGITTEMAASLAAAFGTEPAYWMGLEAEFRLARVRTDLPSIQRRAKLFELAPIRDMQKRGWIRQTSTVEDLRAELAAFFEGDIIEQGIHIPVATRRTIALPTLTPAEVAWCFRARRLAKTMLAVPFSHERLAKAKLGLRRLATHPKEARHIAQLLADCGIRFMVIEPLPGAKIDGAALWDEIGPIIAVSIRHDRIDGFWFTLMHEFEHIYNEDPISVDSGLVDGTHGVTVSLVDDVAEDRANKGAASSLIPTSEIDSFINRVGPLYAKDRVIQFANRIKIHPGIIVGQLQHRKELGYMALRDFLVKIRENVISTALTDGWGHSISPINI